MKPFLQLKPVDEVLSLIWAAQPLGSEQIDLAEASGRHIYCDFHAPADLPGFRRSSMDGYAVIASDVFGASESSPAFLHVAGDCPVGICPDFGISPGSCAAIVTGAGLPQGADAVVMIEDTRPAGPGSIEITRPVAPGANIISADEDARKGQLLIPAGRRIRAQEAGILAAFGMTGLTVFKRPTVAILSTGDEIAPVAESPGPCRLRDVNSASLSAFCSLHSALPLCMGIVPDEPGLLAQKLSDALPLADAIAVSGGSSAGMRDYTAAAFLSLPDAKMLAHGVAMAPGKPFILAQSGKKLLLGLPGHVSSCLVCAHVFLAPILARLQGQTGPAPRPWINAILSRSIASAQGRRDYIRCRLDCSGSEYIAEPLRKPSAVLGSLLDADGFVICPENSEGLGKGQQVKFYPLQ